ncbi:Dihydroneopterin aldolase-domain-containing protein [Pseudoneurospora amorphoporcata]|uniref:Dihydroneopterin aldolase-domain-containing protein n=1 Tax=Pseudoneurospora amorphoporcata TaxID=241081 RepID=A0AAN6NWH7_9PEZI|nr:Dihydroneopterin aldolase-domain-containing protein [Pseudoneurospora amorphoporcata]
MADTFVSDFHVRSQAGEPCAAVSVRNLSTNLYAASDAWGRKCTAAPQPCLISAQVHFKQPFGTAAANDQLGADTVHYGNLSKAILERMKRFTVPREQQQQQQQQSTSSGGTGGSDSSTFTLAYVIHDLWVGLTGWAHFGSVKEEERPFLDLSTVKFLSLTVTLPKASLLGDGVSMTCSQFFKNGPGDKMRENPISASLKIHNLKVPTLVGVNPHERRAKQFVTTSVNVERYFRMDDYYSELERLVVKALDESSYETLEALGAHLADKILEPDHKKDHTKWQVHIRMEKPTAVPLADCPIVEVRAGYGFPAPGRPNAS